MPAGLRVLIIDDNEDFAENLEEILEAEGARIQRAGSLEEARSVMTRFEPQVAFVDLRLPDGSGEEILPAFREMEPPCLAIVLTGNATVQSAIMAVDQGAFAFLLKDMPVEAVIASYRKARERRALERQKHELEGKLRHQEQLAIIGEMAATLAHEIRNPLTGIRQALEVILEVTGEPPGMEGIKDTMIQRFHRLHELVDDLLRYSRPVTVEKSEVSLVELTEEVLADLRQEPEFQDVRVELQLAGDCERWRLDENHFRMLLRNLLENAAQAMERAEEKVITVSAARNSDGALVLGVRDLGTGIAIDEDGRGPEDIFKPFFTTRTKGTGLGLPLAQRIVEEHGGTIHAENHPEGGAVFTVKLPG